MTCVTSPAVAKRMPPRCACLNPPAHSSALPSPPQYSAFCNANVHVPADWSYVHLMCNDNLYFGNAFNVNGSMHTVAPDVYLTNVIGNSSLAWLETVVGGDAPFFAYIAPHAPHVPATPAHEYENAPLPHGDKAPRTPSWDYATQHHHWLVSEKEPLSPALINFSDELFARRLRSTMSVDDIVAAVYALLRAKGALDNTYVGGGSARMRACALCAMRAGAFDGVRDDTTVSSPPGYLLCGPRVRYGPVSFAEWQV